MISPHVDDCYVIGDKEAVDEFIDQIKSTNVTVKLEWGLKDCLSCEVAFNQQKTKAWTGQPHMVKKLENKFGKEVSGLQKHKTPGTPGVGISGPKEGDLTLDADRQANYRSGTGMLLYLVKHSRPDIANAVRELSKMMDYATPAAEKEMHRVTKYVLDTRHLGLKVEPKFNDDARWELIVYSDSDWAGDKDTRKSVTGFLIFLNGVLIVWRSKSQKAVALSSLEAELCACAEAAKESKFIVQLMLTMGLPVILPVVVRVDNVGAIFLAENASSSARTRHIDARHEFMREMTEDSFLKIAFVKSEENKSDGHTKNLSQEEHDRHAGECAVGKEYLESG